MGGGSSGYSLSPIGSEEDSERIFRSAVDEVQRARIRNVFISFHVDDEAQVNLMRAQAKSEDFDIEFRDYSVKEPFDQKWRTNCRERIAQTSMVFCMIGKKTADREAVNWELEEAYRQGKEVIGVKIYRDKNYPIPKPLRDHNAPIVEWDLKKISRLLDKK
ncbi:MAG: TIR domain-containing protein [Candidatus Hodarchaeota archaeon]